MLELAPAQVGNLSFSVRWGIWVLCCCLQAWGTSFLPEAQSHRGPNPGGSVVRSPRSSCWGPVAASCCPGRLLVVCAAARALAAHDARLASSLLQHHHWLYQWIQLDRRRVFLAALCGLCRGVRTRSARQGQHLLGRRRPVLPRRASLQACSCCSRQTAEVLVPPLRSAWSSPVCCGRTPSSRLPLAGLCALQAHLGSCVRVGSRPRPCCRCSASDLCHALPLSFWGPVLCDDLRVPPQGQVLCPRPRRHPSPCLAARRAVCDILLAPDGLRVRLWGLTTIGGGGGGQPGPSDLCS